MLAWNMPEKMQHRGERRDNEAQIYLIGQATSLTPVASGNHHIITAMSYFPMSHLGNTQLSLEHLRLQVSINKTAHRWSHIVYLNKEY